MRIRIAELIRFYDHTGDHSKHAGALTGLLGEELAIRAFGHFVQSRGQSFRILEKKPNTGKTRGPRLDAWLEVGRLHPVLYQTEVKNWSVHSIGGKELRIDASRREICRYKKVRWEDEFSDGRLLKAQTRKVLQRMKPPEVIRGATHFPLLIYWFAVHPLGLSNPFFSVRVRTRHFQKLWVFSVSSYLRRLRSPTITLQMPLTKQRLALLKRIIANKA